jgi:hypothetical protein
MVEILDQLGEFAKERASSLERTSKALAGQAEGLLVVAEDSCNFVRFLCVIWAVVQLRFRKGGVPSKRLLQECDLLLNLGAGVGKQLALIDKVWRERGLPSEVAEPIFKEVEAAGVSLDSLLQEVHKVRELAATPPRLAADPDKLKQRIREADERGEWVKLSDMVSQMRQRGSPTQE